VAADAILHSAFGVPHATENPSDTRDALGPLA